MNTNMNVCNNCGKLGHQFNQCKLPIISYGIILFTLDTDNISEMKKDCIGDKNYKFLMIRRKDSFGFIDFIRGKYNTCNINQIQNIVNEMSNFEKERLLNDGFDKLWKDMWSDTPSSHYKNEELSSFKKFDSLKNGINIDEKVIKITDIVNNSHTNWIETEWEFPKGRKNFKEKDLVCALREFEEETGIPSNIIKIVENILPFEETFIGTNHKAYKHKYFLAFIKDNSIDLTNFQKTEVSKLEWKNYDECINSIRPYNLEKKKLITNINKVLQEYRLYS
uniref:Nudix hydrolase domain-containing protein n=1 Tax=viral metagenome TaxID=1070528 RepID=A0A6C0JFD6_9ZZZZ